MLINYNNLIVNLTYEYFPLKFLLFLGLRHYYRKMINYWYKALQSDAKKIVTVIT